MGGLLQSLPRFEMQLRSLIPKRPLLAKHSRTTWHAQHGASATHVVPASPTLSTPSACLKQEQDSRSLMSSRRHAAHAAAAALASFRRWSPSRAAVLAERSSLLPTRPARSPAEVTRIARASFTALAGVSAG